MGIAVINEREGLGDGFYKLPLLRALKRAYPVEKVTWVVSEGDSPYSLTMAEIVRPYLAQVLVDAHLRRPTPGTIRRLRPKVMTVACMFFGLVPIMWSTGTGADVMKRIAAPMIGGILTSFILELVVYPPIFAIWKWNAEVKPDLRRAALQ